MGVRIFTDSTRWLRRNSVNQVSGNFKMEALYDGTAGVQGLSPHLPGTENWMDASGLYRLGSNIGPTFMNLGAGTVDIYGSQMPRDYAHLILTKDLTTVMTGKWERIGAAAIASGASVVADKVYSLIRFVFASNVAGGQVVVLTM